MFFKWPLFLLLLAVSTTSVVWAEESSVIDPSRYRKNRPDKDSKDFFGYRPKHSQILERNPWGFHEFWWIGPEEKGPYTLQIAKDSDFKELIYFQTVNRFYDFTRHLPDKAEVYWRVLYEDRETPAYKVKLVPGKTHGIKIEPTITKSFDLNQKISGSIILKWSDTQGRGPYDVEVSPDPDFSTLVFRKRVKTQSYKIKKFAEAGQFYWRVKLGRFKSSVGRFRINQSMVNAALQFSGRSIELESPLNGGAVDIKESSIEFKWKSLGYKTQYRLEVARTGDFEKIVFVKELNENKMEVPTFKKQGTYFWRITSPRYESPIHSFVLSPGSNLFQKGFSLFNQILFAENEKSFFFSLDYRLSSLRGNDLDNSTSGTLVANQFLVFQMGLRKKLYPTWFFETSIDYSLIERDPPPGFEIRSPVSGLLGAQAGVENLLLKDFQAGLFIRYNEFELAQTITGSFFEMDSRSTLNVGGKGEYKLFRLYGLQSFVGASFYSALPLFPEIHSAMVSQFYMNFEFKLWGSLKSTAGLYYQNIGVVSDDASQSSDASGINLRINF